MPTTDTFIEKDASINEEVEKLRHAATAALLSRRDVVVVASVSLHLRHRLAGGLRGHGGVPRRRRGATTATSSCAISSRSSTTATTTSSQRGTFRVRGDVVDVFPPYADHPVRVEFFGDEIESIAEVDQLTGEVIDRVRLAARSGRRPTTSPRRDKLAACARDDPGGARRRGSASSRRTGKLLEAQRLEMRTNYDLEMLETMGFCSGIENYSRHLDGRKPGEPPNTLIDYFPDDFLCIIDESHVTVPQIRGMYEGDRSRKITLVEHGFRLPSALDNRPLRFDEFEQRVPQFVYVSATPGRLRARASPSRSSSRSSARPAWSIPRSSCGPSRARSTT